MTGQPLGRLASAAFGAGWTVGSRVPPPLADLVLDLAAELARRGQWGGTVRLTANLRRVAPHLDERALGRLGRDAMRSYLRYWDEVFRLPRWSPQQVRDRVVLHDAERLLDAYARGRGVVAALPHAGNWDLAGAWAGAVGMPPTTVAEQLRPEALYERFVGYRTALGMEVLPLTGGAWTFRALVDRLRAGRFVPLLADRDLSRAGLVVDLLGEPASLPSGPARLAQVTGAPLLPITCDYAGPEGADGRMHLWMHPPVPPAAGPDGVRSMTAAVAAAFTGAIRAAPADWHMLQQVFVADLPPSDRRTR